MDFLNKAFAQLNDLFRSMTPGGRITAGLLLVVAVVSVGYLFQSQVSGGDEDLFGGDPIETADLQKMRAAFGTAGLNGFTFEGDRVKVPRAQRNLYLAALADKKALPMHFGDRMKEAADGSLMESPKQHEERWKLGKELEISAVIRHMKGIVDASVIIDSQPPSGLGQPGIKTASVSVQAAGGAPLEDDQVDAIRYWVKGAIAGMKPDDVTITDSTGGVYPTGGSKDGPNGDPYAKAVLAAEHDLSKKIHDALRDIPGVIVTASVVLDHETGSHTVEIKNDPKPVPVQTEESSRTSNRESSSPGGAPGLATQSGGVNQPASLASAGGKNETNEESKNKQVNVVSTTNTEKESDGRATKSAKVAVRIPASHYEKVWRARNPTKPGEDPKPPDQAAIDKISEETIQNVRMTTAALVPSPDGKDPTANVVVTTYQDLKPAEIPGPGVPQRAMSWLGENWPMIAMVGLVLVSVGMLRSALRGVPAPASETTAISARISATEPRMDEKEEAVEVTAARRLRRMTGTGPSLRDELSELVKDDPDSAANILRTWIGQVT